MRFRSLFSVIHQASGGREHVKIQHGTAQPVDGCGQVSERSNTTIVQTENESIVGTA